MVDGENYQRMQQDETWVTEQFRKAWETQPLVTEDALASRDLEIQGLKDNLRQISRLLDEKMKIVIWTCAKCGEAENVKIEGDKFLCLKCGSKKHLEVQHQGPIRLASLAKRK